MLTFYAAFQAGEDAAVRCPASMIRVTLRELEVSIEAEIPGVAVANAVADAYNSAADLVISWAENGGEPVSLARAPVESVSYIEQAGVGSAPKMTVRAKAEKTTAWPTVDPIGLVKMESLQTDNTQGRATWTCRDITRTLRAGLVPGAVVGFGNRMITAGEIQWVFSVSSGGALDLACYITEDLWA